MLNLNLLNLSLRRWGVQKNYQRALKFLPQIFGSETSDRVDNFLIGPLASKKIWIDYSSFKTYSNIADNGGIYWKNFGKTTGPQPVDQLNEIKEFFRKFLLLAVCIFSTISSRYSLLILLNRLLQSRLIAL